MKTAEEYTEFYKQVIGEIRRIAPEETKEQVVARIVAAAKEGEREDGYPENDWPGIEIFVRTRAGEIWDLLCACPDGN